MYLCAVTCLCAVLCALFRVLLCALCYVSCVFNGVTMLCAVRCMLCVMCCMCCLFVMCYFTVLLYDYVFIICYHSVSGKDEAYDLFV